MKSRFLLSILAFSLLYSVLTYAQTSAPASVAAPTSAPTLPPAPLLLQDHALVNKIWGARAGSFINATTLFDTLTKAHYILLGETHDNPEHHRHQLKIIDALVEALSAGARKPALLFEQFDVEHQAAISAAQNAADATAETIATAGKLNRKGWQWPQYAPMVSYALTQKLTIGAANLSRAQARKVYAEGFAALESRFDAALFSRTWNATRDATLRAGMVQSHCGQLPPEMAPGMVAAHRARDAVMAQALYAQRATGAILIAGRGHVNRALAIPLYLQQLQLGNPQATMSVVAFIEVDADKTEPTQYTELQKLGNAATVPFDFVWFTSKQSRADPCAGMMMKLPPPSTPAVNTSPHTKNAS